MKKASLAMALLLAGWFGSPQLYAAPGVPEKQPATNASPESAEPYGAGVAIAIVVVGGLAIIGRRIASNALIRSFDGSRGAKVLHFPSKTLSAHAGHAAGAAHTDSSPEPLRRVQ
ncbi:MAG: hypothetical protein ABSF25_21455 [Bryobacteraceae bacterium]